MAEVQKKVKRKTISKTLRFEVFKRDQFTCQYCGRKAPDVVLQIDHINPVAKGGKNSIMNLVTSCHDCNLGKGARTLSDHAIVERQRKQAEMLAQRREQIEMLRDWQLELLEQENLEIDVVDQLIRKLNGNTRCLSEHGRNSTIRPLLKKYPLQFILESIQAGFSTYNDTGKTLDKLAGICINRSDPAANRKSYILNVFSKKYHAFDRAEASNILRQGYELGGDDFYNDVLNIAHSTNDGNWNYRKEYYYGLVERWK